MLFLQIFLLISDVGFAQIPVGLHVSGGMIAGTPYTKPPEGATGQPGIGRLFGAEVRIPIWKKITLRSGIYYAEKGSQFQSPVSGKYNISDGVLGVRLPFPLRVNYTGQVEGNYKNEYLDFPIYLNYRPFKHFSIGLGYQFSKLRQGYMAGEVDVKALLMSFNDQEFDQSALIKKFDQAFLAELNFHFLKIMELKIRGNIGTKPILTEDASGLGIPKNYYLGAILAARIF